MISLNFFKNQSKNIKVPHSLIQRYYTPLYEF
jgi:hypothetical protein